MAGFTCGVCDKQGCTHKVGYYHCDKCNTDFCERCWNERLHEDQEDDADICGNCYADLATKAAELTEPEGRW